MDNSSNFYLSVADMEEDQHFCLKWNNYQSNMTAVFDQLRENEAFVDVTLACEGSQLKAHKVSFSCVF